MILVSKLDGRTGGDKHIPPERINPTVLDLAGVSGAGVPGVTIDSIELTRVRCGVQAIFHPVG
jgi:hypothetical protein